MIAKLVFFFVLIAVALARPQLGYTSTGYGYNGYPAGYPGYYGYSGYSNPVGYGSYGTYGASPYSNYGYGFY